MLQIDYKSGMSICDQVVGGFMRLIAVGVLKTGDSLPSVRSLASKLSVNPNTVQKAYAILEERGAIYSVKGKGSFVADSENTSNAIFLNEEKNLETAVTAALRSGFPKTKIIEIVNSIYAKGGEGSND